MTQNKKQNSTLCANVEIIQLRLKPGTIDLTVTHIVKKLSQQNYSSMQRANKTKPT